MARSYAKLLTSIWRNDDYLRLGAAAQRMYVLLLSQPDLSPVGVLTVAERRLADLAPDTTVATIRKALSELQAAAFIVVDDATSEAWVRSFLHHDGVLTSPNVLKAAARSYSAVHSVPIREHIIEQVPVHLREGFREGFREVSPKRLGELIREPSHDLSPIPHPHPEPSPEPDDDEEGIWSRWALRRLEATKAAGVQVAVPERWLTATRASLWGHWGPAVEACRLAYPDWDDDRVIAEMEGEEAGRAPRVPCGSCDGRGVVELPDGTCAPCTCMEAS